MNNANSPMSAIVAAFPRLRRSKAWAIIHSGGQMTAFGCLCGSTHSVDTRHRDSAAHVKAWKSQHTTCAEIIASSLTPSSELRVRQRGVGTKHGVVVYNHEIA